jgi:predicted ATPase
MIEGVELEDVTVFEEFVWEGLGGVNVVIGENDTGKSNLLKMMYAVTRSLQNSMRLDDRRQTGPWEEILAEKLRWTFQPRDMAIGGIVRKGAQRLKVQCTYRNGSCGEFSFSKGATKQIRTAHWEEHSPFFTTLFIPPEEILTSYDSIIGARERLAYQGFDDTYYDLARSLSSPPSYGDQQPAMSDTLERLEGLYEGRFQKSEDGTLMYLKGNEKYSVAQAAQGSKKIGMLVQLMKSRYIRENTILFFDEPETNLNPEKVLVFVQILFELAQAGVQIFIATHSFPVLKQVELLAREHEVSSPLCVLSRDEEGVEATFGDLSDRILDNVIVDASLELLNRDLTLSAK